MGGVCNLVISVDCSLNYSHHKYNTRHKLTHKRRHRRTQASSPTNSFPSSTKVHDLFSNGRELYSKGKPDKLSFINETRCRQNHKTRYKLNVSKNDLFTDSDNMNIHTSFSKFIFFFKLYFPKGHLHIMYFVFHIVICILNCLLFNVRCVLFHFFCAIVKFCVVFVVGII